jgi:hypothetical protein
VLDHLAKWAAPRLVRCDIELAPRGQCGHRRCLAEEHRGTRGAGQAIRDAEIDNALTVLAPPVSMQ